MFTSHRSLVVYQTTGAAAETAQALTDDLVAKKSARFAGVDRRDTTTSHIEYENEPGETHGPSVTEHEGTIVADWKKKTEVGGTNGQACTRSRSRQQRSSKDENRFELEGNSGDRIVKKWSCHGLKNENVEETDNSNTTVEEVRKKIVTEKMSISNAKVIMVIGTRGATVKQLQHLSEAKVAASKEKDMSRTDCPVVLRITGTRSHVDGSQRLILGQLDWPCDGNIHERSDRIGGEVMDSQQSKGFGHTGFSETIAVPYEMVQFHATAVSVSPVGLT